MRVSPLSEEEDDVEDGSERTSSSDVEYHFEGFNIEFSEKVALMPAGGAGQAATSGVRRDG
ncbi:MAG TPA: hypothetical protein VGJ48_20070 [Pyrinomonadaceae bacterium]|jgi:hypothetical protein